MILWIIALAWALSWSVVLFAPSLWPIALLGFVQNVAFTLVSRGRNSGSLGYHLVASLFSNSIYAVLLFLSIDMVSQAKTMPYWFLACYTLATMSGSIFAHWFALRVEKGKARSVQDDRMKMVEATSRTLIIVSRHMLGEEVTPDQLQAARSILDRQM